MLRSRPVLVPRFALVFEVPDEFGVPQKKMVSNLDVRYETLNPNVPHTTLRPEGELSFALVDGSLHLYRTVQFEQESSSENTGKMEYVRGK